MRQRTGTLAIVGALAIFGVVPDAKAQTHTQTPAALSQPGVVDVGINLSGLLIAGVGGAGGPGAQVTFNYTARHAIQVRAELTSSRGAHTWAAYGPYSVLYRHTFNDGPNVRSFVTAGMAGWIAGSHSDAFSYTSDVLMSGDSAHILRTHNQPAYTHWSVSLPGIAVAGVGADFHLARRLTMQLQVDVGVSRYGVGTRASTGISVPLGHVTR